jgi:VanZ family protein
MTVIAAASLVPGEVIATVPGTASLTGHAVAYAVLAYVLTRLGWPVLRAGLGAWCYGALIEVLQLLSPGRSLEAADFAANATGAVVAMWIVWTRDRVCARLDR